MTQALRAGDKQKIAFIPGTAGKLILNTLFILVTGFLAFLYFKTARWSMVDDSFITFRYAQNLADGNGLVFNIGERFYGSTAMGFAALLGFSTVLIHKIQSALGLFPWLPLPHIAVLISALSHWLIWFSWYRIMVFQRFSLARWVGGLAIAFYYFNVSYTKITPGHETYTYFALLIFAAYLVFYTQAYLSAGVVLAASLMMRPDALLFAGLVFFLVGVDHFLLQRQTVSNLGRKIALPVSFGVLAVAWEIFLKIYFGSWLPETLRAKKAQVVIGAFPTFTFERFTVSMQERGNPGFYPTLGIALILFVGLLMLKKFRDLGRTQEKKRLVLLAVLWLLHGVGLAAAYILFSVSYWAWYEIPIYYSLVGLIITGFSCSQTRSRDIFERKCLPHSGGWHRGDCRDRDCTGHY